MAKFERPPSVIASVTNEVSPSPAPFVISSTESYVAPLQTNSIAQDLISMAKFERPPSAIHFESSKKITEPKITSSNKVSTSISSGQSKTLVQDLVTLAKTQKPTDKVITNLNKSDIYKGTIINTFIEPIFADRNSPASNRSIGSKKSAKDILDKIKNVNPNITVTSLTITTVSDTDDGDFSDSSASESSPISKFIEYEEPKVQIESNVTRLRSFEPVIQTERMSLSEKQRSINDYKNSTGIYKENNDSNIFVPLDRNATPLLNVEPKNVNFRTESVERINQIETHESNYYSDVDRNESTSYYIGLSGKLIQGPNFYSDKLISSRRSHSNISIEKKSSMAPTVSYIPLTSPKKSIARDLLEIVNKEKSDVHSYISRPESTVKESTPFQKKIDNNTEYKSVQERSRSRNKYFSADRHHSIDRSVSRGAVKLPNGDSYDGQMRHSKFHGKGTYVSNQ